MAIIKDGTKLEAYVDLSGIPSYLNGWEIPPSTGQREIAQGKSRPAYPGFSAKDLAARDVFAWDIARIGDKEAETVESMLARFDNAVRVATAVASKYPYQFEGSDRYLANKIAEQESALVKVLKEEVKQLKARQSQLVTEKHKLQLDLASIKNVRRADIEELRRLKGVVDRNAFEKLIEKEKPGLWKKPGALPLTPSETLKTRKERPMSKGKIAAAIIVAAILGPFAWNQAKGWGGVVADLTPDEVTLEQKLADLEEAQRDQLMKYAAQYRELQEAKREKQELDAFEAEFLAAFDFSKDEMESALALVSEE